MKSKYAKHTLLNSRDKCGKIKNVQLEKETTVSSKEVVDKIRIELHDDLQAIKINAEYIRNDANTIQSVNRSEEIIKISGGLLGKLAMTPPIHSPSTTVKEEGQLFIWNGIEGDLEEVADLKAAKKYIWDYMEDGEIHPDIECIKLFRQIGYVKVEETGEMNGDDPVCTVDFIFNQESGTKI